MHIGLTQALSHTHVPESQSSIIVGYTSKSTYSLFGITSCPTWERWSETDVIHILVLGSINGCNWSLHSDIPQLDEPVWTHTECTWSIICHLDWVHTSLMSLQWCYILPCFTVPYFHISINYNNKFSSNSYWFLLKAKLDHLLDWNTRFSQ